MVDPRKAFLQFMGSAALLLLSMPPLPAQEPTRIHVVQGMSKILLSGPDLQASAVTPAEGTLEVLDFQGPFQADDRRRFNWLKVRAGNVVGWVPADRTLPEKSSVAFSYIQQANGWAWQTLCLLKDGNFLFYQTLICQEEGPVQFTQTSTLTGKWQVKDTKIRLQWGPETGPSWSYPGISLLNKDLAKIPDLPWGWEFPTSSESIKLAGVLMDLQREP